MLLYPILRRRYILRLPTQYRDVYNAADKVVLLSPQYIQPFQTYGKFYDARKFEVIPNAISFPQILSQNELLLNKKNKILVVSRLEEIQKRISIVLRIWKEIKKYDIANEWSLDILGEGPSQQRYIHYAQKHKLKDIFFHGRKDPLEFYKEASIFMMTSRSEGFPLTLGEAMQNGCVPIVLDSFASLKDIISDGENGVIVSECDVEGYIAKLKMLMTDKAVREHLASKAFTSAQRFSQEEIAKKWWTIIK